MCVFVVIVSVKCDSMCCVQVNNDITYNSTVSEVWVTMYVINFLISISTYITLYVHIIISS